MDISLHLSGCLTHNYKYTHQVQVPIQIEVPGCQAKPYYITYDYKYPTRVLVLFSITNLNIHMGAYNPDYMVVDMHCQYK